MRTFVLEYFVVNQVRRVHVYRSFSRRRVRHRHAKECDQTTAHHRCVILKRLHRSPVARPHRTLCPAYIEALAQSAPLVGPEAVRPDYFHTQVNMRNCIGV